MELIQTGLAARKRGFVEHDRSGTGSAGVRDHSALPGEEEDEEVERRQ
jgi:hypothetical protein